MPRFAANLSTLYPEHALLDRAAAAARDGFVAVEAQWPYDADAVDFRRSLRDAGVELVLINAPAGNAAGGERGLAALPGRESDFEASIQQALDYAREAGAARVHVLSGVPPLAAARDEVAATLVRNLRHACRVFEPHGVRVMIEPINARDVPGYYLTRPEEAAALIEDVGSPNLALQFDLYHAQIVSGDIARGLETHIGFIGHVQVAGVPERHEPDVGELNFPYLARCLDRLGYAGWVGCEYRPALGAAPGGTSAGLGWMRRC